MFLGVKAEVTNFQSDKEKGCSFSLIIADNPLNDFVELPENLSSLHYSNIICGVIRGALSTVFKFFLNFILFFFFENLSLTS
jgi:hypothetical protein